MQSPAIFDIDMLTVRDVSDLLCVSRRTIWRWAASGRLPPPLRVGPKCTRWRVTDIQRYVDTLPVRGAEAAGPAGR
jgi:prophage regulatory protein